MPVQVIAPVARGAADPLAFDETLQSLSHGSPRIAGRCQRDVDLQTRRQEERGADRRLAEGQRLLLDMGSCLLRECGHYGLRMGEN